MEYVRGFSEGCQGVVRVLSECCQGVVRGLSEEYHGNVMINPLWERTKSVVSVLSGCCQCVVKGLSADCQRNKCHVLGTYDGSDNPVAPLLALCDSIINRGIYLCDRLKGKRPG